MTTGPRDSCGRRFRMTLCRPDPVTALRLAGDELRRYNGALNGLCKEPELEHLNRNEIDGEMWRLVCRLSLDQSFRPTPRRNTAIRDFLTSLTREWEPFELVEAVGGFSPKVVGLRLGDVELCPLGPAVLRSWDVWEPSALRSRWRGLVAFTVIVRAGSPERASERGRQLVARCLNELRFAIPATLRAHVWDDQLSFPRHWWAVRWSGERRIESRTLGRLADGLRTAWSPTELRPAIEHLKPLYALRTSGRKNLIDRVDTCIDWIGTARCSSTPNLALKAGALRNNCA